MVELIEFAPIQKLQKSLQDSCKVCSLWHIILQLFYILFNFAENMYTESELYIVNFACKWQC
ncbi:hypothetical protein L289_0424 [Acinetobacter gerneri DSM 14967 = CIP 107464 = MTCC 9824]|nr:hypothetical protein L289_0424 [Acinetobacter gerneri DSM 14967 = CIP 107464 = MTCC 9824]